MIATGLKVEQLKILGCLIFTSRCLSKAYKDTFGTHYPFQTHQDLSRIFMIVFKCLQCLWFMHISFSYSIVAAIFMIIPPFRALTVILYAPFEICIMFPSSLLSGLDVPISWEHLPFVCIRGQEAEDNAELFMNWIDLMVCYFSARLYQSSRSLFVTQK